jgi:putative membrane protein
MPDANAPAGPGEQPPNGETRDDDAGQQQEVNDADLRTTLANERTLLAWSRTGLALLAASFAVVRLTGITPRALRLALGAYLIALAIGVTAAGYVQWRTRQARIREPEPAGTGLSALLLTAALIVLTGFVVAVVVVAS